MYCIAIILSSSEDCSLCLCVRLFFSVVSKTQSQNGSAFVLGCDLLALALQDVKTKNI